MSSTSASSLSASLPNEIQPPNSASASLIKPLHGFIADLIKKMSASSTETSGKELASRIVNWNAINGETQYRDTLKAIDYLIELEGFNEKEEKLCKSLIGNYSKRTGYKELICFLDTLKSESLEGIDLKKIHRFLKRIDGETSQAKQYVELADQQMENNLFGINIPAMLRWAQDVHAEINALFANETPPQFLPETLQIVCSLEQLEFASKKINECCTNFMRTAKTETDVAHVTRLIFVILCGQAPLSHGLPMNPVCFILRETPHVSVPSAKENHDRNAGQKQLTVLERSQGHTFVSRLVSRDCSVEIRPSSLNIDASQSTNCGKADIYYAEWDHPFHQTWERSPVVSVDIFYRTPIEGAQSSSVDNTGPPVKMSNLCVHWAAPRFIRERFVCLLRNPQAVPHRFTHPLAGENLNQFADSVCTLFSNHIFPSVVGVGNGSLASAVSTDKKKILGQANINLRMLRESMEMACEDVAFISFVNGLIDLITHASSKTEFQQGLRELVKKAEFPQPILNQLEGLLNKNISSLKEIACNSAKFRSVYEDALQKVSGKHQFLQRAFMGDINPRIDLNAGSITVSLARFRFAKMLFDLFYNDLIDSTNDIEQEAYASHILACILCGVEDAPTRGWLSRHPRCFKLSEFSDSAAPTAVPISLSDGTSYLQFLLKEISTKIGTDEERQFDKLSDEDRFRISLDQALDRFMHDQICRVPYSIVIGKCAYTTQVSEESQLENPIYIIEILENYLQYLRTNPEIVQHIRGTQFARRLQKLLTADRFTTAFTERFKSEPEIVKKVCLKLLQYLKDVPSSEQDLVLLKLLEFMSLINQNLSRAVSKPLQIRLFENANGSSDIVTKESTVLRINMPSNSLERVNCEGCIDLFCVESAVSTNSNSRSVNPLDSGRTCVGQVDVTMKIPSLWRCDHIGGRDCPAIVYSHPRFSAFAPLFVVDEVSSIILPDLVRNEIDSKCAYLWLSTELDGVIAKLTHLDSFLKANERELIKFAQSNFLAAYKLYHKLKILELVFPDDLEHENEFNELRLGLKEDMRRIKKSLQKLEQHSRKVNSANLNSCTAQICKLFP